MKPIYKTATLFIACMFSCLTYAQRPNIIKQPPKINGILKASTNAAISAKIHANSNSVFGTGNNHANYHKENHPEKEDIKKEEDINKSSKSKAKRNKK